MADTKVTALTELTTPAGVDLLYIVDDPAGTPLSRKVTVANLFANASPITIASGTLTASAPALNVTQTWNNAAVTFTGLKFNAGNTASADGSLLMDLQVGGTSRFAVEKTGRIQAAIGLSTAAADPILEMGFAGYGIGVASTGDTTIVVNNAVRTILGYNVVTGSSGYIGFGNAATTTTVFSPDLTLFRDAADTLAQRRTTNAQTFRTYGTYTDASNYRRVAISMTTAGVASIAPEGAGTGASGNVLHISGLPTSNPGPGILWNNAGTPAIGT